MRTPIALRVPMSEDTTSTAEPTQTRVPSAGDTFTEKDLEKVFELVRARQANFPSEPSVISFSFVLFNMGDAYTPVVCDDEDHLWADVKLNVTNRDEDGKPLCPDGHRLTAGNSITLGWVEENPENPRG